MIRNLTKFLLILTAFSLTGCLTDDLDIQNNRRLLVKGKVTDGQGNGLSDIRIATSGHGDLLAETRTDAQGNFNMVSLDERVDPLDIFINVKKHYDHQTNEYSSLSYLSEQRVSRVLYDMGTVILEKKAQLNFTFSNVASERNTVSYEIFYTPSDCRLPLNVSSPPTDCILSETISGIYSQTSSNELFQIYSLKDHDVMFRYSLNGGPLQTVNIPLPNELNSYVFEY